MKLSVRLLAAAVVVLLLVAPAPAEGRNPAELLPAETLAYLELHQPARLSREVAGLIRGSALEDMAQTMAKFRARLTDGDDFSRMFAGMEYGTFGLFVCPEMLSEAARMEGAVVAVTGVNKDGPEIVAILFPGTSNFPGLYLRAFVMVSGQAASGGEVEGVPIYRTQSRFFPRVKGGDGPQTREGDPTYALLPGALVIGTHNSVKDVVRRFKRKSGDPDLAGSSLYRNLVKGREQAGMYGFVDFAALAGQIDAAVKEAKSEGREWQAFAKLVNPQAMRQLSGSLTLQDGNIRLSARVQLDPKQSSLLLDALPDRKAGTDWLHAVPKDGVLSLGLSLGDGAVRWEKALAAANTWAKEMGAGGRDLPANLIGQLEEQLKLQVGKEVFGKLSHLAVILEPRGFRPMLVCTATDDKAAQFLQEEALPRLLSLATRGDAPKPAEEKVLEQKLQSLPSPGLFGSDEKLYSGRDGAMLVLGFDGKVVAEAMLSLSRKEGLGADKGLAAALKEMDGPIVAGSVSLGQSLVPLLDAMESPRWAGPIRPGPDGKPMKPKTEETKAVKDLRRAVEELPPAVVGLTRKADALVLEVQQRDLKKVSAKIITLWVEAGLDRAANPGRRGLEDVIPPVEKKKE
jgi:hypothetical protein